MGNIKFPHAEPFCIFYVLVRNTSPPWKVLVDRTQKAGEKLLDKSLPFGRKEKFDISHAYLHGRDPSPPRNRALFNFMNQACGRYINNQQKKCVYREFIHIITISIFFSLIY